MRSVHAGALVVRAAHSRVIQPGEVVDFDEVVHPFSGTPYSLETALGDDAAAFEPVADDAPAEEPATDVDDQGADLGNDGQGGEGGAPAAGIVHVNAAAAAALVRAATTLEQLDALAADEAANPKHEGGRVSVMRAVAEQRQALTAQP